MNDTTNMPTPVPSRKVAGATIGAGAGTILANLTVWGLDELFEPAVANSVPEPVTAAVYFLIPVALTFIGGYFTKRAASES